MGLTQEADPRVPALQEAEGAVPHQDVQTVGAVTPAGREAEEGYRNTGISVAINDRFFMLLINLAACFFFHILRYMIMMMTLIIIIYILNFER